MSIGGKKAPDKDIYSYIYLLLVSCRQSRFLVEAAFFLSGRHKRLKYHHAALLIIR
ncbi:hypothetical protein [Photobacterium iliopiscarium]|uniref:hypothetical protein n=1 Tax=Photobacterium iliopiscarium TaxID=56192 RepID=UPI000B2CD653|nr:hypothetical protein [Photobacterium iliopiscarium]